MRQAEEAAASADSSEDEEEGNDEYDFADNFLAREDEEEEELAEQPEDSDGEKERKRRKRKRRARALQLDNEDYELLEENQVSVGAHNSSASLQCTPYCKATSRVLQLLHLRPWQELKLPAVAIAE